MGEIKQFLAHKSSSHHDDTYNPYSRSLYPSTGVSSSPLPPTLPDLLLPSSTSDNYLIRLAFQYKNTQVTHPRQSQFRVFSVITYRDVTTPKGSMKYVVGTNCECCIISNNICAERSALVQLRLLRGVVIEKVFLVADSQQYITPGALCREFMFDNFCNGSTVIVTCGENKVPRLFTLDELYPFSNLYINTERERVLLFGRLFSSRAQSVTDYFTKINQLSWLSLYKDLIRISQQQIENSINTSLHPISYTAGVLFRNGKTIITTQHNGIEYGCSLDAITRLSSSLEEEKKRENLPVVILHCDQFGILHAPCGAARSYLYESGLGKTIIVVHTKEGPLKQVNAEDFIPHSPKVEELYKIQSKL